MHKLLSYALVSAHNHDSGGKQRLYAVAADKRGRILAEGANSYNVTHPLQASSAKRAGLDAKCFLHAEISMLISLLKKKVDCSSVRVYVARSSSKGEPMLAKPCPVCAMALDRAGILRENVFFTE